MGFIGKMSTPHNANFAVPSGFSKKFFRDAKFARDFQQNSPETTRLRSIGNSPAFLTLG